MGSSEKKNPHGVIKRPTASLLELKPKADTIKQRTNARTFAYMETAKKKKKVHNKPTASQGSLLLRLHGVCLICHVYQRAIWKLQSCWWFRSLAGTKPLSHPRICILVARRIGSETEPKQTETLEPAKIPVHHQTLGSLLLTNLQTQKYVMMQCGLCLVLDMMDLAVWKFT